MAEQEGAQVVEKSNRDVSSETTSSTTIDGECQLLPLLQGLLEAPDNEQTADSGTESGEDQRTGLIVEVQTALNKLSESLLDDQNDIQPERRQSLLQLVTKLQAGLAGSVPLERRSSSTNPITNQNRFTNRRRQRSNRHTVGVSSEELADARRLIEEIALHELATPKKISLLQKQNSEGSVIQAKPLFRSGIQNQKVAVRNATAKPFSSSNSTISGNSSSVQTPTEPCVDLLFNEEAQKQFPYRSISLDEQTVYSNDVSRKTGHQGATNTVINENHSETEDDSTIKALPSDIKMQNNPIYYQKSGLDDEKLNRFNSKKLKMKRANTIDIPKPFKFFNHDHDEDGDGDDSDCSLPEDDFNKRRRSNYLALRGPIRLGGTGGKNTVPVFEPKTENDRKFLAFINKNNEAVTTKTSLWAKPTDDGTVWKNKFGNIKTAFERATIPPKKQVPQNSAKQFWKTTEMQSKWSPVPPIPEQKNIVSGSLKVKTFEPKPINQFSHAPQSAFKPIPKRAQPQAPQTVHISKTVIKPIPEKEKEVETPLYLYSPKPMNEPQSKHWVGKTTGESRVMNLVASKFENPPPIEVPAVKPRKLSKDAIGVYDNQMAKPAEKLTAPYLVKSLEDSNKNTVRKLSGQYDNYASYSTVKYTPNTSTYPTQYQQLPKQYPPPQNQQRSVPNQYQPPNQYQSIPSQPQYRQNQYQAQATQNKNLQKQFQAPNQHNYQSASSQKQMLTNQYPQYQQNQYQALPNQQQKQYQASTQYYQTQHQYQPAVQHYNHPDQHQYTSSVQNQAKPNPQVVNAAKPTKELPPPPRNEVPMVTPPKLESQVSVESIHEYNAVSAKVMTGPVSQQAETIRQKSPMNRDEHDFAAAMNLRNSLQKLGNKTEQKPSTIKRNDEKITNLSRKSPESFSIKLPTREEPPQRKSPHSFSYSTTAQKSANNTVASAVSTKFQIPVINVAKTEPPTPPISVKMMNKADAWQQICIEQQQLPHKPSPRSSPNARTISKSKSSHSLSVPKQFEAGMSKDEMQQKRKTLEAYLSSGNRSPTTVAEAVKIASVPEESKVVKRSINRLKTSEKSAMYRHTTIGLARSRTLPDFVTPQLLDESNVEEAFDELFNENS